MANHRHNQQGRFASELDIDAYTAQTTITRAGKLAWLKRAARAGGGYVELITAHPAKLDALMGVERDRRATIELMSVEPDGSRPTIDPAPSSVRAGRVLVTHPRRVRRNAAYIAANGASIPVEPAPKRELKLDVKYNHHTRTGVELLTAQGRDMRCYTIDAAGKRTVFEPPTVERDGSSVKRAASSVDAASSYSTRVERFGANVELAAE